MDTQERIANIIAEELNIKLVQVVRTIELIKNLLLNFAEIKILQKNVSNS